MKTKFRYCKDDNSFEAKHNDKDWNDGLSHSNSFREIAYQLKRIADALLERGEKNFYGRILKPKEVPIAKKGKFAKSEKNGGKKSG